MGIRESSLDPQKFGRVQPDEVWTQGERERETHRHTLTKAKHWGLPNPPKIRFYENRFYPNLSWHRRLDESNWAMVEALL